MRQTRTFVRLAALALSSLALSASLPAQSDSVYGRADFLLYCSACHGEDADGQGPVANVLTPRPPALTNLGKKYGRPLGTDLVTYILGTTMPRAHGTSDMPVWGRNLDEEDGFDTEAIHIIWEIVSYLESLQPDVFERPESAPPKKPEKNP